MMQIFNEPAKIVLEVTDGDFVHFEISGKNSAQHLCMLMMAVANIVTKILPAEKRDSMAETFHIELVKLLHSKNTSIKIDLSAWFMDQEEEM